MKEDQMVEEIDVLHWRIDQVHQMLIDLANRLGQQNLAEEMLRFNNDEVQRELEAMRGRYE